MKQTPQTTQSRIRQAKVRRDVLVGFKLRLGHRRDKPGLIHEPKMPCGQRLEPTSSSPPTFGPGGRSPIAKESEQILS
jgi:hypothetical protein